MERQAPNPHIFREYDIRGVVGKDLDDGVVEAIGRAFGTTLRRTGGRIAAVGHDIRPSSAPFAEALIRGINRTGCDAIDIGEVPTPLLYYAVVKLDADGGVMITGSHNPPDYNGLKICVGKWPIFGEDIRALGGLIEKGDFSSGSGSIQKTDVIPSYHSELLSRFQATIKPGFRVVVDAGNGTAGPIIVPLLRDVGCQPTELYCEPDGRFPNHLPDPEVPEYMKDLIRAVEVEKADIGLGFDGDSDRVGVIDEGGRKVSADKILLLFARYLLAGKPGGKVIFDVKCSDFLGDDIRAHGGIPIMWKTGHSLVKKKLRDENAIIAGELSGHICVAEGYYGYDDAFFAALFLLEILSRKGGRVSDLFADMPVTYSTPEVKASCADDRKFAIVADVRERARKDHEVIDIDGARILFDGGWALVRASNTTPNLTLRVEARTPQRKLEIARELHALLSDYPELGLGNLEKVLEEEAVARR